MIKLFCKKYCNGLRQVFVFVVPLFTISLGVMGQEVKTTAEKSDEHKLEEVLVTAQKRTENVRDVPMALSVFDGDELKENGISSFNDLAALIPNVSINDTSNSLYIRGIGTAELNAFGEQAIAYIVDGVYLPKLDYLGAGFLDLARMEVLKGPQGTLYGRNATAGVFNITNAMPTDDWNLSANITGGNRDIEEYEAAISGPVLDKLSFRLAAKRRTESGSSYSIPSDDTLGNRVQEMARLSLRFEPTETLDISVSYTDFDYFHGVFMGYEFHVYPEDLRTTLANSDPNFESELDRRTSMPRNKGDEFENRREGEGFLVPVTVNWEAFDHIFTSITSHAKFDGFGGGDVDNLSLDLVGLTAYLNEESYSQEFRVVSPPGKLEYIAGIYYFQNQNYTNIEVPLYADFFTLAAIGGLGVFPVGDILGAALGNDSRQIDNLTGDFDLKTKSYAIYGQAQWSITDTLKLIVGIRQSRDVKDAVLIANAEGPAPFYSEATDAPFDVDDRMVDKDFSPKYSVTWEPLEEVTAYLTLAKGFRAGSYNAGATTRDNVRFDAERSTTLEAGVKTELLDGRVRWNWGLFHTNYYDYQLSAFTGFGYVTANAPEVEMRGSEMDITALLLPGLIFNAAVGYNDAKFIDHKHGACTSQSNSESLASEQPNDPVTPRNDCDLSGKRLHRAPVWSVSSGLDFQVPLTRLGVPWNLFTGISASFKDEERFDSDLDPLDSEDDYWTFNAKIGVASSDGKWRLTVHGKNLSDELRKTWSGDGVAQSGSHIAATTHPKHYFANFTYMY